MTNIAFITAVPADYVSNAESFDETITADFFKFIFFGSDTAARVLSFFVVLSAFGTAAIGVWR